MNKKILISLLAIVLTLVMAVPALAETYTTTTTETTELPDGTTVTVTTTVTITVTKPEEAAETEPALGLGNGLLGGWTVNPDSTQAVLPEDVQAAFDAATAKLLGVNYTPVAYLGSQVVAGTNYAVLAKKTIVTAEPETTLVVLIISKSLEGEASVLHVNDFSFEAPETESAPEQLAGGWTVPEEYQAVNLPAEVASAFDKANEALLGNRLDPIAFLASQTVSGMNYAILCRSVLTTENPVSSIQLAIVYEDLEGNASFKDIFTVNPADYNFDAEVPSEESETEASAENPETGSAPVLGVGLTGSWDVKDAQPEAVLPDDVKAAFDVATAKLLGVDYVPVAYLGSQVVAGTNYAVLCKKTAVVPNAETTLAVLIIYKDLNGDSSVLYVNDFDFTAAAKSESPSEPLAGGWTFPEEYAVIELPEGAKEAFEKANEGFLGNRLEPIAYLGSQLVSGSNYAILCRSTLATNPPVTSLQVAIVYEDLEGNASFSDVHPVSIADYNQDPVAEAEEPAPEPEPAADAEEPAAETDAPAAEADAPLLGTGLLGGWDFSSDDISALPEEVQEAFDTAVVEHKLLGVDYVPVAYLGSQVVAGTNYAVLCRKTVATAVAEPTLAVLIIYKDLEGDATILHISDFAVSGDEREDSQEAPLGGWTIPSEFSVADLPEDAAAAFAKACEGFVGNKLDPIAYLGRQVVNGTNYAILCRSTLVTAEPVSSIQVVIVSEDPEGNATFSGIRTVHIAEYNQDIEP